MCLCGVAAKPYHLWLMIGDDYFYGGFLFLLLHFHETFAPHRNAQATREAFTLSSYIFSSLSLLGMDECEKVSRPLLLHEKRSQFM